MPDPATPDTPLADPQQVLPESATSNDQKVTPDTPIKPDTRPSIKVLQVLAVSDQRFSPWSDSYFKNNFEKIGAGAVYAKAFSLDDFVKVIEAYSSIGKVVILSHANGSDLVFGTQEKTRSQIFAGFTDPTKIPKIDEMNVEGCTFGLAPVGMLEFAKFFKTPTLTGYNLLHGFATRTVTETSEFPSQKAAEDALAAELAFWEPYFQIGMPSAAAVVATEAPRMAAPGLQEEFSYAVEWFTQDSLDSPDVAAKAGITFPARGSAVDRVVTTDQQATDLATSLMKDFDAAAIPAPLYRTVIQLGF